MRVLAAGLLCGLGLWRASGEDDLGYLDLFEDALDEVQDASLEVVGTFPDWLNGDFYQVGPGRWTVGNMSFTHLLDGFGKLHKWSFNKGQIKFTSKFVRSAALNQSIAQNEIIWGVLAQETAPPRNNPGIMGFFKAPNDNNNVQPWLFEQGHLAVLSDTATMLHVDPASLDFQDEIQAGKMTNGSNPLGAPATSGASAHPHCAEDGSFLGLREAQRMASFGNSRMSVYKVHQEAPTVLQDIVYFDLPKSSYTHSFGMVKSNVTQAHEYAVVVVQPINANMINLMRHATLKAGFDNPKGVKSVIHILPMDNSKGEKQKAIETDPFYFGHFLNSHSSAPGKITFDIDSQAEVFFDRFSLDVQRDKSRRDNWAAEHNDAYSTPTRFEVDIEAGTVSSHRLFPDPKTQCGASSRWCEFDLFKLHPDDYGHAYCGFWAQQVFFNSSSFASQGIVRTELCTADGVPKVAASWHQPHAYPGEVAFIPKPGSMDKTDGVLVFKIYEGDTKKSKIIVADAKTLATLASAVLPVRVPFTVHANFYEAGSTGHCKGGTTRAGAKPTSVFV